MALKDIKGERLERSEFFSVFRGFPFNLVEVHPSELLPEEKEVVFVLSNAIGGSVGLQGLRNAFPGKTKFGDAFSKRIIRSVEEWRALERVPSISDLDALKNDLSLLLAGFFPEFSHHKDMAAACLDSSIGFDVLAPFLADQSLEEVMVNGSNKPVFVVHRRFGMCKTNAVFVNNDRLNGLVKRIAKSVEKAFDENNPLLDARLSDGSRINATISNITPDGCTLTIRKFFKNPLAVSSLVGNNTLSSEAAAFLWLMVEGLGLEPMNLIVTGGASSGKTTSLNALAAFCRFSERIISIEDTLELDLGDRENWVRLESRLKSGGKEAVDMDGLLKNALRMRPDRLVVGEVRGEEAQTMFIAMDTGHRGLLGTLHSNTAREMLLRLQEAPMNVSLALLPLLNLIVVQIRLFLPGKGIVRRVSQIAELSPLEGKPLQAILFQWNRSSDQLKRTETPSHVFELLAERTSLTKNDLKRELLVRQRIIEWLVEKKIFSHDKVSEIVQRYYADPQSVVDLIQSETVAESESVFSDAGMKK